MVEHTLEAYRIFWMPLCAYIMFAIAGACWLCRPTTRQMRHTRPVPYQLLVAGYLALVFTPSFIGDFWAYAVPGPAFAGFLIQLALVVRYLFTQPGDLLRPIYGTSLLHLLPIVLGFALTYSLLWALRHCRSSAGGTQPI